MQTFPNSFGFGIFYSDEIVRKLARPTAVAFSFEVVDLVAKFLRVLVEVTLGTVKEIFETVSTTDVFVEDPAEGDQK